MSYNDFTYFEKKYIKATIKLTSNSFMATESGFALPLNAATMSAIDPATSLADLVIFEPMF